MNDKSLGWLIFVLGLVGAILYVYWLFAPVSPNDPLFFYIDRSMNIRWALVLPILMGVLAILGIAIWIGWTMAITPPPPVIFERKSEEKKPEEK